MLGRPYRPHFTPYLLIQAHEPELSTGWAFNPMVHQITLHYDFHVYAFNGCHQKHLRTINKKEILI